jgi:crossover junction endodeoxyribonuclease RusA
MMASIFSTIDKKKQRRKTKAEYAERFAATPAAELPADGHCLQRNLFERHDSVVVALRFPLAPSVNHYWRSWVRPGSTRVMTHVSNEGQAYKAAVKAAWFTRWKGWPPEPLAGRIRLLITVGYFDRRSIDLDNRVKPLQDALTECGVWIDDDQVDDLRIMRGPIVKPTGAMDVIIESIPEA